MANKFEKRKWPDRQSRNPARRRLIPTETEGVYDVEREEGEVTEPGRSFSKDNMEDLEERIHAAFGNLDATDIALIDSKKLFTANTVEGAMEELFQYAAKGKSAIAAELNTGAGDTFDNLAAKIRNLIISKNTQINSLNAQINNLNAQINNLNGELQKRKKWYYGVLKVPNEISTADISGKKRSISITFDINFGFLPKYIIAYHANGTAIVYNNSSVYWNCLLPVDDSYPTNMLRKAGLLFSANKLIIKAWTVEQDGSIPIIRIKKVDVSVLAIGD